MSERNEVLQLVLPLIQEHVPERLRNLAISEDTDLSKDLGINSAYIVEIVLGLEEVLVLKPGDVYSFRTVRDLVDYVMLQRNISS